MKKHHLFTIFVVSMFANIAHANPQINVCVAEMTQRNIADNQSAQKVCNCVVKEQSKITQAQKNELDNWVKQGKDIRSNKTFQTISNRIKACGNGIKFNN